MPAPLPPTLLSPEERMAWLDEAVARYEQPAFIAADPIALPHLFTEKEDIEIAGLLAATLAWGRRATILAKGRALLEMLHWAPAAFIRHHTAQDRAALLRFGHRTFTGEDAVFFARALQHIYLHRGGLEAVAAEGMAAGATAEGLPADARPALVALRQAFFECGGAAPRTRKHFSDVSAGAAAKRLNMYLRWMVRPGPVDFGLWRSLSPAQLLAPLDVHSGRAARALGLLHRPQNDLRAVLELTAALRALSPTDPVRYDLALFGLGAEGLV